MTLSVNSFIQIPRSLLRGFFIPSIIDHFRGCLKEIAQELGERHYSSEAEKVLRDVAAKLDRASFSQAQVERIARGEHPIVVLLEPYFLKPE